MVVTITVVTVIRGRRSSGGGLAARIVSGRWWWVRRRVPGGRTRRARIWLVMIRAFAREVAVDGRDGSSRRKQRERDGWHVNGEEGGCPGTLSSGWFYGDPEQRIRRKRRAAPQNRSLRTFTALRGTLLAPFRRLKQTIAVQVEKRSRHPAIIHNGKRGCCVPESAMARTRGHGHGHGTGIEMGPHRIRVICDCTVP